MHTKLIVSPLLLASVGYGYFVPRHPAGELHMVVTKPKAFHRATPNRVTQNYMPLQRSSSTVSRSSAYINALRFGKTPRGTYRMLPVRRDTSPLPLASANNGQEFLMEMTFGDEKVMAIMDTGSSDTWLIQKGFQCTDQVRNKVPEPTCKFGPAFNGTFEGSKIADQYFSIQYGDGEFVTGDMGFLDVGVGGVTIKKQEVALGTDAYWNGDGVASGLVGLAYGSLTSAYKGTNPDEGGEPANYDPLFTSMYKQNLTTPMFSIALQNGDKAGYIAFGGLPPISFDQDFAKTPIQMQAVRRSGSSSDASDGYSFYAIKPDALEYEGSGAGTNESFIVDSGTSLSMIPSADAKALNALFTPAGSLDATTGLYLVPCSAKGPEFSVKIGGKSLKVNPADLIATPLQPGSDQCISGIQDGGSTGINILGDTFMKSVVCVFDVGAAEMRFAQQNF